MGPTLNQRINRNPTAIAGKFTLTGTQSRSLNGPDLE